MRASPDTARLFRPGIGSVPAAPSPGGGCYLRWQAVSILEEKIVFGSRDRSTPGIAVRAASFPLPLYLGAPPYDALNRVRELERLAANPLPPGAVLGFCSPGGSRGEIELESEIPELRRSFPAASLVLVLHPGEEIASLPLARRAGALHVRAVLIEGAPIAPALRRQLTEPFELADEVIDWLRIRGLAGEAACFATIRAIFERAGEQRELGPLLAGYGERESTVRYRFRHDGLPSPGHWLAVARAVRAALVIQRDTRLPLTRLALECGYSDYSSLSHQTHRLFGVAPVHMREAIGWEWLLDRWLERA